MSSGGQQPSAPQTPFSPNYRERRSVQSRGPGNAYTQRPGQQPNPQQPAQQLPPPPQQGNMQYDGGGYSTPFGGYGGFFEQYRTPFSGFGGGYGGGYGNPFGGYGGGFNQPFALPQNPYNPYGSQQFAQQPPPGMEVNPNYQPSNRLSQDVRPSDMQFRPIQARTGTDQPSSGPNAGKVKNPYYIDRFSDGSVQTMDNRFSDSEYINPEALKNYENRLERNKNTTARYEELKNTPITDAQRNSAMYTLAANKGYNRVGEGATDPNTVMNFLKENNIDYSDDALKSYRSPFDFAEFDFAERLGGSPQGAQLGPAIQPNPGFRGNFSDYGDAMRNQGIGFGNPYGGYGAPYGGNPYMGMFGGLGSLFGGNGFQGMNQQARAQQMALENQRQFPQGSFSQNTVYPDGRVVY